MMTRIYRVLFTFCRLWYNEQENFSGRSMADKNKEKPKAEEKQLRDYEMVLVVSPEIEGEALDTAIGNVSQFIIGKGGTVSTEERWGKKKLAYPLKRFQEGSYVLTRFKMKPTWSKELEASLKISENVLRHLLVRLGS
jgi:small subunit ribosomal protein S6